MVFWGGVLVVWGGFGLVGLGDRLGDLRVFVV